MAILKRLNQNLSVVSIPVIYIIGHLKELYLAEERYIKLLRTYDCVQSVHIRGLKIKEVNSIHSHLTYINPK